MSETGVFAHGDLLFAPSVSKMAFSTHRDLLLYPSVSETGLSAHGSLLLYPSVSETGVFTHGDLFLSPSEQKDGSRGMVINAIGRCGFPRTGLGAPSLAPAGPAGRKPLLSHFRSATPKPSTADHSQQHGYP